jgi:hypothetical protein
MRAQYTEELLSRAERDPPFRERLLDDPSSAVQEALRVELPPGLEIRVLEEGPNEAILVLPAVREPGQLREEEMAGVAGGWYNIGWETQFGVGCVSSG